MVPAGGSAVFDTGVRVELPLFEWEVIKDEKWPISIACESAGFLKSKSGLMVNHDITSDGTIDFTYRGSIHVKLFNQGTEDYYVKRGDRISQLVIVPVLTPTLEVVTDLDETERGSNGFGSSGR